MYVLDILKNLHP